MNQGMKLSMQSPAKLGTHEPLHWFRTIFAIALLLAGVGSVAAGDRVGDGCAVRVDRGLAIFCRPIVIVSPFLRSYRVFQGSVN